MTHYEQDGTDAAGVPVFRHVTDRFENIEIVADLAGGSLHGANTMALGDIDGDGDDDLFWGDFFEQGLLFIENRGSARSPSFRSEPVRFPTSDPLLTSGSNAPTVVRLVCRVTRSISVAFLAPEPVEMILAGQRPQELTVER